MFSLAPLITSPKKVEEPVIVRRSLGGRRATSLSKHRFTLAPETIRLDGDLLTKKEEEKPKNSSNETKDERLKAKKILKPCLSGQENIVSSHSILSSLLHLNRRKSKKDKRQSLFYDIETPGDESGKENACQLISGKIIALLVTH